MDAAEAIKELEQVITSSPLFIPKTCNPSVSASVPEFNNAQYLDFLKCEIFFSKLMFESPNIKLLDLEFALQL